MARSKLVEELKRAMLTEEKMVVMLLDLCGYDALPSEIPAEKRKQITDYLSKLRDESGRHAVIVSELIAKCSGGPSDGNGPAAT